MSLCGRLGPVFPSSAVQTGRYPGTRMSVDPVYKVARSGARVEEMRWRDRTVIDGILGIDVCKNTLDVSISSYTKVRTKSFTNSPDGWRHLLDWLIAQKIQRVHACLESTGPTSGLGASRTLVPLGAAAASSSTSIASRPFFVMQSAIGPLSSSRRQTGSEPLARTSSSKPALISLSTTLRAALPLTFAGSSTPRSSRCEAADRMMSCVSVSFDIGILRWVGAASFAATTTAPPWPSSRRGRIPRRALRLEQAHYRSVGVGMPVLSG